MALAVPHDSLGHKSLHRWGPVVCAGVFIGFIYYFVFIYPNAGFPLTIDFTSWLTAARMVADGHGANLYDLNLQLTYQRTIFGSLYTPGGMLVFNRIPFFLIPLIPLSQIPFIAAYILWMAANLAAGGLAIWLIVRQILPQVSNHHLTWRKWLKWIVISLSFFPVFWGLYLGQTSLAELLLITIFFLLYRNKHEELAGVVLALGSFKPQMIIPFGLILILRKSWRGLAGFSVALAVLGGISISLVGIDGVKGYFSITNQVYNWNCIYGVFPDNQQSWRGLLVGWLTPSCNPAITQPQIDTGLSLANVISNYFNLATYGLLAVGLWFGRKTNRLSPVFDLLFVLAVITSLVASPYSNPQELTRLILVAALLIRIFTQSRQWLPQHLDIPLVITTAIGIAFLIEAPVMREIKPFFFFLMGIFLILFYRFFRMIKLLDEQSTSDY